MEEVLLIFTIEAREERHVAVTDIIGTFLTADINELIYMQFNEELVEILLKIDKEKY